MPRAVQNGATTLAESFLFFVGAGLVLGESYRSSKKEGKRRDAVQDRLESLEGEIQSLRGMMGDGGEWSKHLGEIKEQYVLSRTTITPHPSNCTNPADNARSQNKGKADRKKCQSRKGALHCGEQWFTGGLDVTGALRRRGPIDTGSKEGAAGDTTISV